MKAKIEVFESPMSLNIIHVFNNINDFLKASKGKNWFADQVAVNDCVLLGWDELYDFV